MSIAKRKSKECTIVLDGWPRRHSIFHSRVPLFQLLVPWLLSNVFLLESLEDCSDRIVYEYVFFFNWKYAFSLLIFGSLLVCVAQYKGMWQNGRTWKRTHGSFSQVWKSYFLFDHIEAALSLTAALVAGGPFFFNCRRDKRNLDEFKDVWDGGKVLAVASSGLCCLIIVCALVSLRASLCLEPNDLMHFISQTYFRDACEWSVRNLYRNFQNVYKKADMGYFLSIILPQLMTSRYFPEPTKLELQYESILVWHVICCKR